MPSRFVTEAELKNAKIALAEVFAPDEIAVVHVMNRVVRRCFLLGSDPVTGKNSERWQTLVSQMVDIGQIKQDAYKPLKAEDAFTMSFLETK